MDSCASSADSGSDRDVGESSPSPATLFFIRGGIQSSITRMHYERMRHIATVMERPTKPSSLNSPTGGSPTPPSFDGPIEDESLSEGFEDGDLRMTVFDTGYYDLPWTIDDTFSFSGSKSVKNPLTERGEYSTLTLSVNARTEGHLSFQLNHNVFMPWALLQIKLDGELLLGYPGHEGESKWEEVNIPVKQGHHDLTSEVKSMDLPTSPNPRGTRTFPMRYYLHLVVNPLHRQITKLSMTQGYQLMLS